MFYHINGVVTDMEPNLVVLECGGVGYALNASLNTISSVKAGERVKLYIYEIIREDAHDLYGFASKSEKHCFELLLAISGVGPKAALSILSSNTPDGLALAVLNGDEKALTSAPGIGKRIAQRILLELKDKMAKESASVDFADLTPAMPASDAASGCAQRCDRRPDRAWLQHAGDQCGAAHTAVHRGHERGSDHQAPLRAMMQQ